MSAKGPLGKAQAYQAMAMAAHEVPDTALDDRDELKSYGLGVVGYAVYASLMALGNQEAEELPRTDAARALGDADPESRQHASVNEWRNALADATLLALVEAHAKFGKPEYQRLLRDIVQGTMAAAKASRFSLQETVKLLFTYFLYVCPHAGQAQGIRYIAKTVACELLLCKLSCGVAMKLSCYAIGEAIFAIAMMDTLQSAGQAMLFTPQLLIEAATEGVWAATEIVVPDSPNHFRDNGMYVVRGFSDSEQRLRKSLISGTVERILTLPVIGWIYRPVRWMVLVAYNRLRRSPLINRFWNHIMSS